MSTPRVQLQVVHTLQNLGYAVLYHRIGKLQVVGVFGQAQGQAVLLLARPKQNPRVAEKLRKAGLHMAHRPLLQNVLQACAGGHRYTRDGPFKRHAVGLGIPLAGHAVVVTGDTQTQHIGARLPLAQQSHRLAGTAIRTQAPHVHGLAHEVRVQVKVVVGRTQADTDNFFHRGSRLKIRLYREAQRS